MTGRRAADGLQVDDLVVRFGGVTAVNGLTMSAPIGQITGLIGPNGAGKTTTFNACLGTTRPSAGRVTFRDIDLSRMPISTRAKVGIGRTFQRVELCDSLSVRDNVALGREAGFAGTSPRTQLMPRRGERAAVARATSEALEQCSIGHLAEERAGRLSTGQRRLVELARALAGDFSLLLLDEPSSGLDVTESEEFTRLLLDVVASRGLGVLIVEHDMTVIRDLCNYAYVLDFGQLIFSGTPAEILASDLVRKAYLGTIEVSA